jgi:hypothetical protein
MNLHLSKLNRLCDMSLGETLGRGRQELTKLADRFLTLDAREVGVKSLYHELSATMRGGSASGPAEMSLERLRAKRGLFLPSLARRAGVIEIMNKRFRRERDEIVASAEKAVAGKFDLLGFTDLDFGFPIDWRLAPPQRRSRPPHSLEQDLACRPNRQRRSEGLLGTPSYNAFRRPRTGLLAHRRRTIRRSVRQSGFILDRRKPGRDGRGLGGQPRRLDPRHPVVVGAQPVRRFSRGHAGIRRAAPHVSVRARAAPSSGGFSTG